MISDEELQMWGRRLFVVAAGLGILAHLERRERKRTSRVARTYAKVESHNEIADHVRNRHDDGL